MKSYRMITLIINILIQVVCGKVKGANAMNIKNRLLTVLLALALMITYMPVPAFAEGTASTGVKWDGVQVLHSDDDYKYFRLDGIRTGDEVEEEDISIKAGVGKKDPDTGEWIWDIEFRKGYEMNVGFPDKVPTLTLYGAQIGSDGLVQDGAVISFVATINGKSGATEITGTCEFDATPAFNDVASWPAAGEKEVIHSNENRKFFFPKDVTIDEDNFTFNVGVGTYDPNKDEWVWDKELYQGHHYSFYMIESNRLLELFGWGIADSAGLEDGDIITVVADNKASGNTWQVTGCFEYKEVTGTGENYDISDSEVKFVDEDGAELRLEEDKTYSTDAYKAMFYKAHEGVFAEPALTLDGKQLDKDAYSARYTEVRFNEKAGEWQPAKVDEWTKAFPAEAGVYLCEIHGNDPYSGTREWIDLIRVEDHAWGTAEYNWNEDYTEVTGSHTCSVCDKTVTATAKREKSEVIKAPTLTEKGEVKYTSEGFEEDGFEVQTVTAETELSPEEKAAEEEKARQGVYDKTIPKIKGFKKSKVKKNSITVKWTKLTKKQIKKSKVAKIEIWVCPNKKFAKEDTTVKTVSKSKASATIKGLKKNKNYYVKLRGIRNENGVSHVGKWTSVKKIKTSKK